MNKITGNQVNEVIQSYQNNHSIIETAKKTGISTVKVRKILITEGLWESDTSNKIGELIQRGMKTEEIANTLCMTVKNVQAYMPYERGLYGGEEVSKEAIRSDKYRNRMRKAADMQMIKTNQSIDLSERSEKMKDNQEVNKVMKLQLELDMEFVEEEEKKILHRHAYVNKSISRDILVPADITLHALHYAIVRMFGWMNSHLHHFSLPDNIFAKLTKNKFMTWSKMAGIYFRFPSEDFEDLYWDDDYKEGQSVKSWMRKKYTGPYKYGGFEEHYLINQEKVKNMIEQNEEIIVQKFLLQSENQPKPYKVKLKEATVNEVKYAYMDFQYYELIERLPLSDIMCLSEVDFSAIRNYIKNNTPNDLDDVLEEYDQLLFKSSMNRRMYLESHNILALPLTNRLNYEYDYGDGWKVSITCEDIYEKDHDGNWSGTSQKIEDSLIDVCEEVIAKHRPICIKKDGIELVDDVGGIHGFCDFLKTIYEIDINDEEAIQERENMLDWADMMGWTGRRISPKQTL